MKLRVLYVEGCRDGTVGGSHVSLLTMLSNLDRERFEPIVVFYDEHHVAAALRAMEIDVRVLPNERPFGFGADAGGGALPFATLVAPLRRLLNLVWYFLRPALAAAWFLRRNAISVVHLNNSINTNHEWLLGARCAGVGIVCHERGISPKLNRTARLLGGGPVVHVCISREIRQALVDGGMSAERSLVVYNGIDTRYVTPQRDAAEVRASSGILADAPIVGVVGNIKRWKGQEVAVRATALLVPRWPTIRCLLVGGAAPADSYRRELELLARKLGIERNLIFTGFTQHAADYLNVMDVVVHPSIEPEPFGRVNIEAMYLRKPVVATRIGGPTEIFNDGHDGYLVEPNRPDLLAERLGQLIADADLRRTIGERAQATVTERFMITGAMQVLQRLYEQLNESDGGHPDARVPLQRVG